MAEENEKLAETNGTSTDFDIPTLDGGNVKKDKKKGVLGLGGGSGGTQAVGMAARSGPIGLVFRNLGLFLRLGPAMGTMAMGIFMPAYNQARNKAIYEEAIHRAQLLKSATALPADEAVDKMRQNTNLDNESLIRAKNSGSGMKFGDDAEPANQDDAAAAGQAVDAGKTDPATQASIDAGAAQAKKMADDAAKQSSSFGKSEFGNNNPFGNSTGGSSGAAGGKIVNYAPESKFGSLKGGGNKGKVGGAMAGGKATGVGRDGRAMKMGKKGKGFGQLKLAALYSKKAAASKYQASAALAGKAFDSGTMNADNSIRGVDGAGIGNGGAGVGEGDADQTAANAQAKGIGQPTVAAIPAVKNESCEGKNLDAMKPPVMTGEEYDNLTGKCDAQKKMNLAFIALAVAALATIGLAIAAQIATKMETNPYTAVPGAAWHGAIIAVCAGIIVIANAIAIWAAADAMKYPSLKGQATGLLVGAAMVDVSAALAMWGGVGVGGTVAGAMANAGSNAMQGMQGTK